MTARAPLWCALDWARWLSVEASGRPSWEWQICRSADGRYYNHFGCPLGIAKFPNVRLTTEGARLQHVKAVGILLYLLLSPFLSASCHVSFISTNAPLFE